MKSQRNWAIQKPGLHQLYQEHGMLGEDRHEKVWLVVTVSPPF